MPLALTYFNVKGRGELSRLILALGGVEYVDQRIAAGADTREWHQDRAAKSPANLLGDSLEKQAEVTSLLLQIDDVHCSFARFWFTMPEAERAEKALKEVTEGATSKALAALGKYLANVQTDFLFGDSISLADLAI
ncbi:MAG: hypothetical protein MHM6MM_009249, partial [Cercozoa sp. M6MM]